MRSISEKYGDLISLKVDLKGGAMGGDFSSQYRPENASDLRQVESDTFVFTVRLQGVPNGL
jgi:hypothetical protein